MRLRDCGTREGRTVMMMRIRELAMRAKLQCSLVQKEPEGLGAVERVRRVGEALTREG